METFYHQTSQLIQETTDLFHKLESDPDVEKIENDIQAKINAISAKCERLDVLVFKMPINQRPMAKMRVDQLKYDNRHIQASLTNVQNKRRRREQEQAERDQLLNRRFGHDHTDITVDYLAQEQNSLHNSHRNVDEMLYTVDPKLKPRVHWNPALMGWETGTDPYHQRVLGYSPLRRCSPNYKAGSSMLETLRYNRETLKGAHRRLIDLANTLGLSNATISLIERRVSQDKYVLFGGMFVTLAVIVLVIIYLV